MSKMHVAQISAALRKRFERYLDLAGINATDPERDVKVVTRCLAAYGVQLATGCSDQEAAESVWDGGDDNGIDAALFDHAESRVVLVQSKWIQSGNGEPVAKDLRTFTHGASDLVDWNLEGFHDRLKGRVEDIANQLLVPGNTVHLVVISTGKSQLSKHGIAALDKFAREMNASGPVPLATYEVLGADAVFNALTMDMSGSRLSLQAQLFSWNYVAEPYPAYFGMVDGLTLRDWWRTFGKALLAGNIRQALGATEINSQIRGTAVGAPETFWYFNNGITVVAEEAPTAPAHAATRVSGNFVFKGATIVNGAQTVSSLGAIEDDTALGRIRVSIRVILLSTAPPDFGKDVTRTNNLQNRIESRDFVAQDPEQHRIRQQMAIEGVDYQFVRGEETISSSTSCELTEVTTALACASADPALAVQIKTGVGRFYADLTKPPYKLLFNASTAGNFAFNATLLLRAIDSWIDSAKKGSKRSGPAWGVLVHGNRLLASLVFKGFPPKLLSQSISEFSSTEWADQLTALADVTYAAMVKVISESYENRHLAVLFKNPSQSKDVFDRSIAAMTEMLKSTR